MACHPESHRAELASKWDKFMLAMSDSKDLKALARAKPEHFTLKDYVTALAVMPITILSVDFITAFIAALKS